MVINRPDGLSRPDASPKVLRAACNAVLACWQWEPSLSLLPPLPSPPSLRHGLDEAERLPEDSRSGCGFVPRCRRGVVSLLLLSSPPSCRRKAPATMSLNFPARTGALCLTSQKERRTADSLSPPSWSACRARVTLAVRRRARMQRLILKQFRCILSSAPAALSKPTTWSTHAANASRFSTQFRSEARCRRRANFMPKPTE
mmetsp:Transcript_60779/g.162683  ORF Transcript_60779/g.162683 Transcript_60779/m.162683 type:complete len:201 (-) Transcript_60779:624-1226(-)